MKVMEEIIMVTRWIRIVVFGGKVRVRVGIGRVLVMLLFLGQSQAYPFPSFNKNGGQGYNTQQPNPGGWNGICQRSGGQYGGHVPVNYPQQQQQHPRVPTNQWNDQNQAYMQYRNDYRNTNKWYNNQCLVTADVEGPKPSIIHLRQVCQEGKVKEAIELMNQGIKADADCFTALFHLCGKLKSLENAKKVHDYLLQSTCRADLKLNNDVLEMYGKCASMRDARRVFDHMLDKNIDSWHLVINGYVNNGLGDDGLEMFEQMRKLGMKPNEETFLAILSACACMGAIQEGFIHFNSMKNDYGVEPKLQHYLGVLDVLCQPGHLIEAVEYVEMLPFEPTVETWERLWNYARIHGDMDLEEHAEELMINLDPSKDNPKKFPTPPPRGMPTTNMLEGKSRLVEFKHPTLYMDDNKDNTGIEGFYIPDTKCALYDIDQEEKEQALLNHSTRLAISYGLMNTPPRTTLKIFNDHRICYDCHNAVKVISWTVGRKLLIRDDQRFHHFKNGKCSCRDFW